MLKRFYSKRSGFTLVEIVVAFAIFAIMASMVAQILDLAIKARQSNNQYAIELARQQQLLTVVEKNTMDMSGTTLVTKGQYAFTFNDGTECKLDYQVNNPDPTSTNREEGINYFVSMVNYSENTGEGTETPTIDPSKAASGSQASMQDTRIMGTVGFNEITIYQVVKETRTYDADSPFYLPPGYTRYFFEAAASVEKHIDGALNERTQHIELQPYAAFKLCMYTDQLAAESANKKKDENGKEYTEDIYKEATIVNVGFIDDTIKRAIENGLTSDNTSSGIKKTTYNPYLLRSSGNIVDISTPHGNDGNLQFKPSNFVRFYVDFKEDPNLTPASFGNNGVKDESDGSYTYKAFPVYKSGADQFNEDGSFQYNAMEDGSVLPAIYGAYVRTRHYVTE